MRSAALPAASLCERALEAAAWTPARDSKRGKHKKVQRPVSGAQRVKATAAAQTAPVACHKDRSARAASAASCVWTGEVGIEARASAIDRQCSTPPALASHAQDLGSFSPDETPSSAIAVTAAAQRAPQKLVLQPTRAEARRALTSIDANVIHHAKARNELTSSTQDLGSLSSEVPSPAVAVTAAQRAMKKLALKSAKADTMCARTSIDTRVGHCGTARCHTTAVQSIGAEFVDGANANDRTSQAESQPRPEPIGDETSLVEQATSGDDAEKSLVWWRDEWCGRLESDLDGVGDEVEAADPETAAAEENDGGEGWQDREDPYYAFPARIEGGTHRGLSINA